MKKTREVMSNEVGLVKTQGGEQGPGVASTPGLPIPSGPRCSDPFHKGCARPPRQEIVMPGSPHGVAPRPCCSCAALLMHKSRRDKDLPPIRTNAVMKARL